MGLTMSRLSWSLAVVLALVAVPGAPGQAQRGGEKGVPQAFAVVQAPEGAVEACHATTVRAAQDCALTKCQKKAGRGACFAVTACAPSGWAGIMGVKLRQVHFSESICGGPSREALIEALKAFCRGHLPQLEHCALELVWGPDGKAQAVNLTWTAQELAK